MGCKCWRKSLWSNDGHANTFRLNSVVNPDLIGRLPFNIWRSWRISFRILNGILLNYMENLLSHYKWVLTWEEAPVVMMNTSRNLWIRTQALSIRVRLLNVNWSFLMYFVDIYCPIMLFISHFSPTWAIALEIFKTSEKIS